jgi:hypothetical protein
VQRHNLSIRDLCDIIKSFQMKVDWWLSKHRGKMPYMLPILDARLEESNNGTGLNERSISEVKVHLLCLKEELSRYFQVMSNCFFWSNLPSHLTLMKHQKLHKKKWSKWQMTLASNPSSLPFRKHNFGLEGSWIIQHLQKLFWKFLYRSQQNMRWSRIFYFASN